MKTSYGKKHKIPEDSGAFYHVKRAKISSHESESNANGGSSLIIKEGT